MHIIKKTQPVIHPDDHAILTSYTGTDATAPLKTKLAQCSVPPASEFPRDVVRLHSRVVVRDKMARMNFTYHVGLPGGNQSVVAPIGMAILGLRMGDEVKVRERNSRKYYIVMEVSNPAE